VRVACGSASFARLSHEAAGAALCANADAIENAAQIPAANRVQDRLWQRKIDSDRLFIQLRVISAFSSSALIISSNFFAPSSLPSQS